MKKYIFYFTIGMICLTPLLWFKGDLIIAHGDDSIFLNPSSFFKSILWSWDGFFYNCGGANNSMPLLFPFSFFWSMFTKLGMSLAIIEKTWLVLVWLITGFAMFYLVRVLGLCLIASFFSSLLYLLNVFVIQQPLVYNFRLPYMIIPLLFAFTVKGLDLKANMVKYAILFGISTLLMASAWTNPPWAVIAFIPISLYIIHRMIFSKAKDERLRVVFYCITTSFFVLLLNLWWLIPYYFSLGGSVANIKSLNINIFTGRGFYEVFRFLKSWAFGYSGYDYHKIYYNSCGIIFATYLIPMIVFSSLLRRKKGFIDYFFFMFFAIAIMFLAKGPLPPLGNIYNYLFYKVPGFVMFREPYTKFMPLVVFGFSILFGDSVAWIYNTLKNKHRSYIANGFIVAAIFLVGFNVYPAFGKSIFLQRQVGLKQNKGERSSYTEIPKYWQEANKWVNKNIREGRLFVVPRSTGVYNWESGFNCGGAAAGYLLNSPVISCSGNGNTAVKFLNYIYDAFARDNASLCNMLKIFNASYILHDKDVYTNSNWRFYDLGYLPPNLMKKRLKKEEGLDLINSAGHLSFYKIKDSCYLPKIYAADNLTFVNGALSDLALEPIQEYYKAKPAFIIDEQITLEALPKTLQAEIDNVIVINNNDKDKTTFKDKDIVCIYKRSNGNDEFTTNLLDSTLYNMSVKLKLLRYSTDQVIDLGKKISIDLVDMLSGSKYYSNLVSSYSAQRYFEKFKITTLFDGNPKEDEYVQIKDFNQAGNDIDIDLMSYPYLRLCYRVEDPRVQILQIVLGIDINRDGEVDFWLNDIFERPASTDFSYFYYNAYKKAQIMAGNLGYKMNGGNFYCHAIKLEIYPHKCWGVDCSKKPNSYGFYVKGLEFCSELKYKTNQVIKVKGFDKIFLGNDAAVKLDSNSIMVYTHSINLGEYYKIEFQWLAILKDALVNVDFILDTNGDGVADREETVYTFNSSTEDVAHVIDFRNVMDIGNGSVNKIKLLAVKWNSPELASKYLKRGLWRIKIYKEDVSEYSKLSSFSDHIFSIDNKKYNAEFSYFNSRIFDLQRYGEKYNNLRKKMSKSIIVKYKNEFLTSGKKVIRNLLFENDAFNIDWICFKKTKKNMSQNSNSPEIIWRKINPTRYLVEIKGATKPFLLVFSESFHKGWRAYILSEMGKINNHIPVNGYAQAWWIETKVSDFQLSIEYLPQKWTNIGWGISLLTLICSIVYLGLSIWKK